MRPVAFPQSASRAPGASPDDAPPRRAVRGAVDVVPRTEASARRGPAPSGAPTPGTGVARARAELFVALRRLLLIAAVFIDVDVRTRGCVGRRPFTRQDDIGWGRLGPTDVGTAED